MKFQINKSLLSLGILSSILAGSIAFAEEESSDAGGGVLEEQVVLGRFLGSSQQLLLERQEDEAIVDVLDAESISRMGDSTVAAALRRVPGLTLINNKFIYVRGLGERYSQSTLNGASSVEDLKSLRGAPKRSQLRLRPCQMCKARSNLQRQ